MIKIMTVIGTRPEGIKMAPLIKAIEEDKRFDSTVVVTGQHKEMLDQVLAFFSIVPRYNLNIMKKNQGLTEITTSILSKLDSILEQDKPDIVLVHGDTTTTFAASLASFYKRIRIGHVEAGLRTWKKYSPYPEEINRQLTDVLADYYFAPTDISKKNLEDENHLRSKIFVTGNTAIDAMKYTIQKDYKNPILNKNGNLKKILVTMHRRENIGAPMINVFRAINKLIVDNSSIEIIFPIHKNPKVRALAEKYLDDSDRIHVIEPLEVADFHNFAQRSYLILSDSGGVQEEAPSLGVPVLVLRDTTERPEGIKAGTLKLIGTEEENVIREVTELLKNNEAYVKMAQASNPYGDGTASEKILDIIYNELSQIKL